MRLLLLFFAALLAGCGVASKSEPKPADPVRIAEASEVEPEHPRFTAEYHGEFEAGYSTGGGAARHKIMIIKDAISGRQYLAVSGIGMVEMAATQPVKGVPENPPGAFGISGAWEITITNGSGIWERVKDE